MLCSQVNMYITIYCEIGIYHVPFIFGQDRCWFCTQQIAIVGCVVFVFEDEGSFAFFFCNLHCNDGLLPDWPVLIIWCLVLSAVSSLLFHKLPLLHSCLH